MNLPASAAGHTVQLRWRMGSDSSNSQAGWRVDTVAVTSATCVGPAGATQLVVSGYPSATTAGASHSLTVTATDASNNTATGYLGTVHFSSSDGAAVLPPDYTFVAGDAGSHVFNVTLNTTGSQSISATDTVTSSITGTQTGIVVGPAGAAQLVVSGYPSATNAGASHSLTVTATDASNNTATGYLGTVHFSSSDGAAVLPPDYTFVAGDAGSHVFNVTLNTTGSQSISATDTVTSSITGTQTGIVVGPAGAAQLVVSGYPSATTAGASHSLTVTATDASNNTATGYLGTVHFSSSDGAAVLPPDYTFVAGDAGSHVFNVTLNTTGSQSISATDTVTSSITGTQTGIVVGPAGAAQLVVSGYPSATTAGASHSLTVTATDASNNTATGYLGTVHFSSSDGAAVLPPDYTFVAGDAGSHVFNVTLNTTGSQSISATDTVTSSITGTQTGIVVGPAGAAQLVVSGYPSATTAGASHSLTVTATDASNNTATGYLGTVHFSSSDGAAVLPPDYTFVAGDAGSHVFNVTLNTTGSQSISATDTVTSSITGTQTGIVVGPAGAAQLVVSGYPSATTAGASHSLTVTATDASNNTATGYLGTVHFSSSDGAAVLPPDYTFVAGDAGSHVFNVTLNTAGSQSISATDTVTSSITGTQTGIVVNVTSLSPYARKQAAVAELQALLPTGSHAADKRLNKAIQNITASLAMWRWNGADALSPLHGWKVFNYEKRAVSRLWTGPILSDPVLSHTANDAINQLIAADRQLVVNAIAASSNSAAIAQANRRLARADALIARNLRGPAIYRLRAAWLAVR